ncbi:PREDICTED: LOW QUALITY PROTEIN: phosphoribosylformylglycinamidine synthase-like [Priapulus caudatus]|uniref:phosphoribosylformylglycinamidine synthase n=1 Tax=Priapulus caudatus TaxID=37621 RepID=A0ABM1E6U6_PRICU|nr:PREDICTED: LOW QUALITY PROTEIN: phosphoribosylformylglycinamidine synthase-like [Priapulus caudatus]
MAMLRLYSKSSSQNQESKERLLSKLQAAAGCIQLIGLETEICYYISSTTHASQLASPGFLRKLRWLLTDPLYQEELTVKSSISEFTNENSSSLLLEIGPRLNFSTAFSTNAVSICNFVGLSHVDRIEKSTRFLLRFQPADPASGDYARITKQLEEKLAASLHDRMTECRYFQPLSSFDLNVKPEPWYEVDVIGQGRSAMELASTKLGLAFDDWDLDFYTKLFTKNVGRNPTSVECFDLAQSNSEHSRHWFFKGRMFIDGVECGDSLLDMVMSTQESSNANNIIKFCDNSSAIEGYPVTILKPTDPGRPCCFVEKAASLRHILFTAETHNFPTGVAPFQGATTGTGGRIRDVQAAGRGGHVVAATAGYCFGNLHIPGYSLPWEDESFVYPANMAPALEIAIQASDGASDYGNKFGEPVLAGFARSCGVRLPGGERREWVKPIMFSAGIGSIDAAHVTKETPQPGMQVVKLGGPVYRIGVGGGAASSIHVQGDNQSELDYGAVQRGDAEMEQKLNRVIRACAEMEAGNPICSIHDQGAGGNGNVLKEIVEPAGAILRASEFSLGDRTISAMELWGAEYQESNAALVRASDEGKLREVCVREKCPVDFVGTVTGDGKVILEVGSEIVHEVESRVTDNAALDHQQIAQIQQHLSHRDITGDSAPRPALAPSTGDSAPRPALAPSTGDSAPCPTLTPSTGDSAPRPTLTPSTGDSTPRPALAPSTGDSTPRPPLAPSTGDPANSQAINGQAVNGQAVNGHLNSITLSSDRSLSGSVLRPVELDLSLVLGRMPRKTFHLERVVSRLQPLHLPEGATVMAALRRVLRLPAVASKRYLTNKVDRSVGGLVAQQQCVGPLHTPLADVAVVALAYRGSRGAATAVGEQPIKGLVSTQCGARMALGEALTNLVFARVTALEDVKCSGNWMWAAKLPGEGAALYDACSALCTTMRQLGVAIDGGKDSLSMAARVGNETVKAPGSLVVSVYAACPDICATVTPDLKCPGGNSTLLHVRFGCRGNRLGGSALAQCYGQIGDESPDMDLPEEFAQAFKATQALIADGVIVSGHDVSDGGIVTCLLEMAFAGNCTINVQLEGSTNTMATLFAEELRIVLEVDELDVSRVMEAYGDVSCSVVGSCNSTENPSMCKICVNGELVIMETTASLRDLWEETSFQLERLQTNPTCVDRERAALRCKGVPQYMLTFDPELIPRGVAASDDGCPLVAIVREEGSNGDREMAAAMVAAGFTAWDVTMQDICAGAVTLDRFTGIAFVGGFSYADVLGSAKDRDITGDSAPRPALAPSTGDSAPRPALAPSTGDPANSQAINGQAVNGQAVNGHLNSITPSSDRFLSGSVLRPVELDLSLVLGRMPRKTFHLERVVSRLQPLHLPEGATVMAALRRVLRLPAVASKRYLTNKVDRSVGGLVAQQQCVGPLHTPLADVAVVALAYRGSRGAATAVGEQPIKGLVSNQCGARMALGEALTNLVFARVTALEDVKCSGNWMWAAKLPGEGAALYDACSALCTTMRQLGVAIDGGKDSLSMAARVGNETVKAPGSLVVSVYAACPDICATVTPDLKCPGGNSTLLHVRFGCRGNRLGGSALAQCYGQIGDESPDMDLPHEFAQAFKATQALIADGVIVSGHDVSDGGIVTCLLEMAFAGNCTINVLLEGSTDTMATLFAEELGIVLEVDELDVSRVMEAYGDVSCSVVGSCNSTENPSMCKICVNGELVIMETTASLRDLWEETSFQLERLQTNPTCVDRERAALRCKGVPQYMLTFDPELIPRGVAASDDGCPLVAIVREEGSNGDREMAAAMVAAGFTAWDVTMQDICAGAVTLDRFTGIAFVGGFSYADVLGSAKGWAAAVLFNDVARAQFAAFRARHDTFSLGVCNGCQLMALLGWVIPSAPPSEGSHGEAQPPGLLLERNESGRFESRFSTVRVGASAAMMLAGMEGSVLGVWVAHAEGRMRFKNEETLSRVKSEKLVCLQYTDAVGCATEDYPDNPNGSPDGIAGVCSHDGRHLAMMPHPERCVLPWQWAWMPQDWRTSMQTSPWLRMFRNAYTWCHLEGKK